MRKLRPHSNIVAIYGMFYENEEQISIVMEYCENGSLKSLLSSDPTPLPDDQVFEFLLGISRGLLHLSLENIIHRDVAARNILLSSGNVPKISDFGMSRKNVDEDENKTTSNVGPIRWMSPEQINSRTYSTKSDVYSFAMLCIEIITKDVPHKSYTNLQVATLVSKGELKPSFEKKIYSEFFYELIANCTEFDPKKRPTFSKILGVLEVCKKLESNEQIQNVMKKYNYEIEKYDKFPEYNEYGMPDNNVVKEYNAMPEKQPNTSGFTEYGMPDEQ